MIQATGRVLVDASGAPIPGLVVEAFDLNGAAGNGANRSSSRRRGGPLNDACVSDEGDTETSCGSSRAFPPSRLQTARLSFL